MNAGKRSGGCLTALALVASFLVVVAGGILVYLVATDSPLLHASSGRGGSQPDAIEPASFEEYSWEELGEIAELIAAEPSDELGAKTAERWGIAVGDVRTLALSDGRQVTATVVGLRADALTDGSGVAGITLMISPIARQPQNTTATCDGGWESSYLRRWLSDEAPSLLPAELLKEAKSVRKTTNNVGPLDDAASLTQTDDVLWAFSLSEVCGTVTLFGDEYGDEPWWRTGYLDYTLYDSVLSGEGEQYEYFAERGVTCSSDPDGSLALSYGGTETPWWYRSAYPASGLDDSSSYFYQVMAGGFPSTLGNPDEPAGVTVGVCL